MAALRVFLLLCLLSISNAWAVECAACFYQDEFSIPEIRVQFTDDPAFASPDYDDSAWPFFTVDRLQDIQGIYWIRGTLKVDRSALEDNLPRELDLRMLAAYEIYINGRLMGVNGQVAGHSDDEIPGAYRSTFPLPQSLFARGEAVVAIRASSHHWAMRDQLYVDPFGSLAFNGVIQSIQIHRAQTHNRTFDLDDWLALLLLCVPLIVGFYFLFIYMGQRQSRHFLVFGLLNLSLFALIFADILGWGISYSYQWYALKWWTTAITTTLVFLLLPLFFLYRFDLSWKPIWLVVALISGVITAAVTNFPIPVGRVVLIESVIFCLLLHGVAWYLGRKQVVVTALVLILIIVGLVSGGGYFFLTFIVFVLFILWQLAREMNQQREKHMQSLVNASRLEAELLRKNIQPHFLMNSLTSLMEWVEVDPEKGAEFVEALGEEFRILTTVSRQGLISLGQEIELCRLHMRIMGFRLQKHFKLELNGVNPDDKVPPAIFHTLVENGISHNQYTEEEITFQLQAKLDNGGRHYRFKTPYTDSGVNRQGTGTGIQYIKAQLERMFPGRWSFNTGPVDDIWQTDITITDQIKSHSQ